VFGPTYDQLKTNLSNKKIVIKYSFKILQDGPRKAFFSPRKPHNHTYPSEPPLKNVAD